MNHIRRHYSDVKVGETVYSHGVPLIVSEAPKSYGDDRGDARPLVYFVGRYEGQELGPSTGLYPFVRRYGDEWTFQRREQFAWLDYAERRGGA